MRISFDIDGVLSDFYAAAVPVINKRNPGRAPERYVPSPTSYDFQDINFTVTELDQLWKDISQSPSFWYDSPCYPENISQLRIFLAVHPSLPVYFVTHRPLDRCKDPYKQTSQWLTKYGLFPRDGFSHLIIVNSSSEKSEIMRKHQIDFSMDDKPETVEQCNNVSGHSAFLFNQPWNQDAKQPRVYSIEQYLKIVSKASV